MEEELSQPPSESLIIATSCRLESFAHCYSETPLPTVSLWLLRGSFKIWSVAFPPIGTAGLLIYVQ